VALVRVTEQQAASQAATKPCLAANRRMCLPAFPAAPKGRLSLPET